MPVITLPDGSQKHFEHAVTVADVASHIGAGLAKAAIAGRVNDQLVDVSYLIEQNADLAIITEKSPEALEIIRHSTAHLLAQAVKQLYPSAQVTIGPVIEDGFYYDFSLERPFTPEDLTAIEARMNDIVKQQLPVKRFELSRDEAITFFKNQSEFYKAEIINAIPEDQILSLYKQGDFVDLCRGPHVPNTNKLKAFKLTKVAGAYWRGDSKNEMLQRIYGTAWLDKKQLEDYLHRIEEAEKRDHRKLGKQFDLFHTQEEAPGMVFWHPKGWAIWQVVEQYLRKIQRDNGYQEIRTPQILDRTLWEKSGHWSKFGNEMFTTESEKRDYAIKPMNCPAHVQVYKQGLKSYRDLPLRLAEFGCCHRNEASGALHGTMRVRSLVQDDGHIFCTPEQVQEEASAFIHTLRQVYYDFGFDDILIKLATRPEQRIGEDSVWDKAEQRLKQALEQQDIQWELNPGEGAFYGPKIEFALKDCLGRVWQCGTLQLDFSMPQRLDAEYVADDNKRAHPVMLHRAIIGSFERFIGVLIEHYAGNFPVWLAPTQVSLLSITDRQALYLQKIQDQLQQKGFRVTSDLRNEKIGFKIREHTLQRVPYLLVAGDREVESQTLSVRTREGDDLGSHSLDAVITLLEQASAKKGRV